jgi:hypothetical protein
MARRLRLLLVCALAPVALASGCGGGGSSGGGSHTTRITGVSDATIQAAKQESKAAYNDCLQAKANSGLTPAERATISQECQAIKSVDAHGIASTGQQLCEEEAALLPAAEQATLRATCKPKSK